MRGECVERVDHAGMHGSSQGGALHEVQRYDPARGWVALRWLGRAPVWFRSRETALCELCELLRCAGMLRDPRDPPDLARYRITDGARLWRPVWNAERATVVLRPVTASAALAPAVGSEPVVPAGVASRVSITPHAASASR